MLRTRFGANQPVEESGILRTAFIDFGRKKKADGNSVQFPEKGL